MAAAVKPSLVLVGFMGAGKSRALRQAGRGRDLDDEVQRALGEPIAEYFAREGEAAFRAREEEVCLRVLQDAGGVPVALGGGALGSARVRAALREHRVLWLDVDPTVAWERARRSQRPLAGDERLFRRLHSEREPVYAEIADAVLFDADGLPGLAAELSSAPRFDSAQLLWAAGGGSHYPVWVGQDTTRGGEWPLPSRRFLVTDGNVGRLYGERLEPLAGRVAVMPGEQSKTVAHAEIVWTELARAGMTRDDHVVGLGGGVVGDLAGFCAATYQRGVPIVHVPTSLVAQVDSAYGGKTGVDLPEVKNYVGAYHQPVAVIVDPSTLESLPQAERAAGYAEVLKTALIAGGQLWERVRGGAIDDEATILACIRTKLRIVAADERDDGRRQVLNLGHTVGHALETATGYARYRHGEAVGLGLLAALRLSGRDDLRGEVAELLAEHELPTQTEGVDADAVLAAVGRDKKRRGEGAVPLVLVEAPGDVREGQAVPDAGLRSAVEELIGA